MKRTFRTAVAVALCCLIVALTAFPTFALSDDPEEWNWANPNDLVRVKEFFNQTNADGVSNGDMLYAAENCENEYDPERAAYLIYNGAFELSVSGPEEIMKFQSSYLRTYDYRVIEPEYFGVLDFSDTSIHWLNFFGTDITAVHLDNCENLRSIDLSSMKLCTELTAGAPQEPGLDIKACYMKLIDIDYLDTENYFRIECVGSGSVSDAHIGHAGYSFFSVWVRGTRFYGWYSDGVCVSRERNYSDRLEGTVDLVAMFKGDADGDGEVTMADSLCIMRMTMGMEPETDRPVDMDDNGDVDMADALWLMRFTMGLK